MKREIKFRAKTLANSHWVVGSYIHDEECPTIRAFGGGEPLVDPDTVGQYTGLKDYNDVEIYEGDIVDISQIGMPERATVKFKRGSFVLVSNKRVIDSLWEYDPDIFSVLGTIHDNPELLKGGAK